MQILDTIQKLGSLYPYFDYAQGYGIPKAGFLFSGRPKNDSAFTIYEDAESIQISISTGYFKDSTVKKTRLDNNYLYAKLMDPEGRIKDYEVIKVNSQKFELTGLTSYLTVDRFKYLKLTDASATEPGAYSPKGWSIAVFFDGCLRTYKF